MRISSNKCYVFGAFEIEKEWPRIEGWKYN